MVKTLLRIISVSEITGGVFGYAFIGWFMLTSPFNIFNFMLGFIALGIYALSFAAGVSLWRERPFGWKASIIIQAIQLPKILNPVIVFMFSFGFDVWVHYLQTPYISNVGFQVRFLAFYQFFLNMPNAPVGLGVSLTSCVFLIALINHRPQDNVATLSTPLPPPVDCDDDAAPADSFAPNQPD